MTIVKYLPGNVFLVLVTFGVAGLTAFLPPLVFLATGVAGFIGETDSSFLGFLALGPETLAVLVALFFGFGESTFTGDSFLSPLLVLCISGETAFSLTFGVFGLFLLLFFTCLLFGVEGRALLAFFPLLVNFGVTTVSVTIGVTSTSALLFAAFVLGVLESDPAALVRLGFTGVAL